MEVVTTFSPSSLLQFFLVAPFPFPCLISILIRKSLHSFTKASDLLHVLEVSLSFVSVSFVRIICWDINLFRDDQRNHQEEGACMGGGRVVVMVGIERSSSFPHAGADFMK